MKKEMHVWLTSPLKGVNCFTDWATTQKAVDDDIDIIHTTQTHFVSWKYGRRIFIHIGDDIHEIKMGDCEGTERELREGHNIEKMLFVGEFSWF